MRASVQVGKRTPASRFSSTASAISLAMLLSVTATAALGGSAGAATRPSARAVARPAILAGAPAGLSRRSTLSLVRRAIRTAGAHRVAGAEGAPRLNLASQTNLGDGSVGQMVIDPVHSHIFVSRPSNNTVEVLSFSGQLLKTITGEDNPFGLVVDNATNCLYVANGNDEISRVGLVDLDIVSPPAAQSPDLAGIRSLTVAAGLIWTAPQTSAAHLMSVVPSTGVVTTFSATGFYQPWLVASPTDTSEFFVGTQALSPSTVSEVTVSAGVPTVSSTTLDGGTNLDDMAVTSNGSYVAVAHSSPYNFSLDPTGSTGSEITLPGQAYPAAVATSPGQGGLVATIDSGTANGNLAVYHVGSTTPLVTGSTVEYGGARSPIVHGLAVSPSGSLAFALSSDDFSLVFQGFALSPASSVTSALAAPEDPEVRTISIIVGLVTFPFGTTVGGTMSFASKGTTICSKVAVVQVGTLGGAVCEVFTTGAGSYTVTATFSGWGEAKGSSGSVGLVSHNPGYRIAASNGGVLSLNLPSHGSHSGSPSPINAISTDFETGGYWLASKRGDVYGLDAAFHGSLPLSHITVNRPIYSVAGTIDGGGYWLLDANGTVYTYGDATNFGHVVDVPSTEATVALVPTVDDGGYWILGSNGQILPFGDAKSYGDLISKHVNTNDVIGFAVTSNDGGYVIAGSDGSAYTFGNAVNHGSLKGKTSSAIGVAMDPVTGGYWLAEAGGEVFAFDAPSYGGAHSPIVRIAPG